MLLACTPTHVGRLIYFAEFLAMTVGLPPPAWDRFRYRKEVLDYAPGSSPHTWDGFKKKPTPQGSYRFTPIHVGQTYHQHPDTNISQVYPHTRGMDTSIEKMPVYLPPSYTSFVSCGYTNDSSHIHPAGSFGHHLHPILWEWTHPPYCTRQHDI